MKSNNQTVFKRGDKVAKYREFFASDKDSITLKVTSPWEYGYLITYTTSEFKERTVKNEL